MPDKSALPASDDFLPHVHGTFQVQYGAAEPLSFELIEVTELARHTASEARQPFSLIFLGPPSDRYLMQHTYRFDHEVLGSLDLFIVPLGPSSTQPERMRYQVIFN